MSQPLIQPFNSQGYQQTPEPYDQPPPDPSPTSYPARPAPQLLHLQALMKTTLQPLKSSLFFHSKCFDLSAAIASIAHEEKMLILVDFFDDELNLIDRYLKNLQLNKVLTNGATDFVIVKKFNESVLRQKRKLCYCKPGIYAMNLQMLLRDLLTQSFLINDTLLRRVYVRSYSRVRKFTEYLPWLLTMLKIHYPTVKITVFIDQTSSYANEDSLLQLYRACYSEDVIIWPFGRSQVHKAVQRSLSRIKHQEHLFHMSPLEVAIQETLVRLIDIQNNRKKNKDQSKIQLSMLMAHIDLERHYESSKEVSQLYSMARLIKDLTSVSPMAMLHRLNQIQYHSEYSIWKSNNPSIMEVIDKIDKGILNRVVSLQRSERSLLIDIGQLIRVEQLIGFSYESYYTLVLGEDCSMQAKRLKENIEKIDPLIVDPQMLVVVEGKETKKELTFFLSNPQHVYYQMICNLYLYLLDNRQIRVNSLRRLCERIRSKTKARPSLDIEEALLLEMLFVELSVILEIFGNAEMAQSIEQQTAILQQINKLQLKFVSKSRLKLSLPKAIEEQLFVTVGQKRILISVLHLSNRHECPAASLHEAIRMRNPTHICFYSTSSVLMRALMIYVSTSISSIEFVDTFAVQESIETASIKDTVVEEDRAFWNVSKARSSLPKLSESPYSRIGQLSEVVADQNLLLRFLTSFTVRPEMILTSMKYRRQLVLVDFREFRSSLPSQLFHSGFTVVPCFLQTGDYIVSRQIAIEKKSVHTKDMLQSIRSGRLQSQIARLSQSFQRPYVLIEFEEAKLCTKASLFGYDSDDAHRLTLRGAILKFIVKFPRIRILWSTSPRKTCELIRKLKENQDQPDIRLVSQTALEENIIKISEAQLPRKTSINPCE